MASVSKRVFTVKYLNHSRSLLTCAISWKRKNSNGIPAPNAMEFFDKLKIQENMNEIPLVTNINRNNPRFNVR